MEEWRCEGREKRRRIYVEGGRWEKKGILEELRSNQRDVKRRLEQIHSRVHVQNKRERPHDLVREIRREKRHRSDRERSKENQRSKPTSLSDVNQIYGRPVLDEGSNEEKQSSQVFEYMEYLKGKRINILEGLKLHTNVFDRHEQAKIVDFVFALQTLGEQHRLKERTYTAPAKWMRGKGRVTLQFGCCYNYAKDTKGNLPGIMRDVQVDPLPPQLKDMIRRLVDWQILPKTCVPDSCIVNIYEKGDCIPPHINHNDFLRPFCTVTFLSEADILFGRNLKVTGPGEFSGSTAIPLSRGSVLMLSGHGAVEARHCVPAVSSKRISITFRKMRREKLPYQYKPDPDLNFL